MKKTNLCFIIVILILTLCTKRDVSLLTAYNFPNPFKAEEESTTIRAIFDNSPNLSSVVISCKIYTKQDTLIWSFQRSFSDLTSGQNTLDIVWNGRNNEGNLLKPDIYEALIQVDGLTYSASNTVGGGTWTTQISIVLF